ncbi:acyl-CoA thioesterase II [Isoptericola sp. b441]|uniref:Acyl-CoA thioesterase II n=1 Tax=Actinotalea lenta TaxID=3064654 RepID=A0ABT9D8M0_9CELL|nr:acyl-CoA thioesterase II [Isoptericola sp. b441]MDO8107237.1 acyl-CoA thioesterase II [Isoptericola sp. b441]
MSSRVQRVLDTLSIEQVGRDEFQGSSLPMPHGRVYGGQVLAQALLAAAATVPDDRPGPRLPHSVHGYFLRPGDIDVPITFAVERMRDGRSFTARRTHALQGGQPILSMISSFQLEQPGLDHQDAPPDVPDPEEIAVSGDVLTALDHPLGTFWGRYGAFDIRHVEPQIYLRPATRRTDVQHVWMKARGPLPDDEVLHRALLAYACDQVVLEPVLRRHGTGWATPGLSVASLDHAMWWHRKARADEWLLYAQASPSAQGGRGLGTAQVFDRGGALVATIAQEGMVRLP